MLRQGSLQIIQSMTQLDGQTSTATTSIGGTADDNPLLISIQSVDMDIIKSFRTAMQQNALHAMIAWRQSISEDESGKISDVELELRDELSTSLYEFEQWKRTIENVYKKQLGLLHLK
jgi:hypothetical protein